MIFSFFNYNCLIRNLLSFDILCVNNGCLNSDNISLENNFDLSIPIKGSFVFRIN